MNFILKKSSFWLARYLQKEVSGYKLIPTSTTDQLEECLQPGDILLVEGNLRISVAIKYLTQSTWSHAALYVGKLDEGDASPCLIEADVIEGVRSVELSKYAGLHTRICRPVGLSDENKKQLISFMVSKLGMQYDLKNAIDLLRYLLPTPPVPIRLRRRMLALGSGDPTRAICSTLIAQAFQSIKYPISPEIEKQENCEDIDDCIESEIMHIRHHSLFTPRDFDISPYFQIIKPAIEGGFEHSQIKWGVE